MPTLIDRPVEEATHVRYLARDLTERYAGRYPAAHVAAVIADAVEHLEHARIRTFVPILLERMVCEVLHQPYRDQHLVR
ncbi:MAG TPA: hypothetical protein VFC19_45450 [Candidatus Limnocylindrales bacterium]|nr:hypothetical protein [Candidatus Limnocylindrales bacterium]